MTLETQLEQMATDVSTIKGNVSAVYGAGYKAGSASGGNVSEEDKAKWDSKAGLITEGGEIFNDYENNKALGLYTQASGYNTKAGITGYYFVRLELDETNTTGIFYISDTQHGTELTQEEASTLSKEFAFNYEVGDIISYVSGAKYLDIGSITEIDTNNMTVTVTATKTGTLAKGAFDTGIDDQIFYVYSKPESGIIPFGHYAVAEGEATFAVERSSHAEGRLTVARGQYGHAEGRQTQADYAAHAEGYKTNAIGQKSHAEGSETTASGTSSHTEGENTTASGAGSHAEGNNTIAGGNYSHAEGNDTLANKYGSHAEGQHSHALGDSSHAEGDSTIAEGKGSHAEGQHSHALGDSSHAEGMDTIASVNCAHAEGSNTEANGQDSHAEGWDNIANGHCSHAEGNKNTSTGFASHAEGQSNESVGNGSHAEGNGNKAKGIYSHAEGNGNTSEGLYSHSEGSGTYVKGESAHGEGIAARAAGIAAHAEGRNTYAQNNYTHAEGSYSEAYGVASHAEGISCQTQGRAAHAEGEGSKAFGNHQHVQGKYNAIDYDNKYAHIVGNGTGNEYVNRSNAHTLDWSGNAWYAGDVKAGDVSLKELKTSIITDTTTSYIFNFSNMYNKEIRTGESNTLSFAFGNGVYKEDYISGLSFDSGETPTSIDYTDSGILNWVGTDCVTSDGLSIFQPSANTHYDIVFYFNGVQFIGLVNGYVPATGNEAV